MEKLESFTFEKVEQEVVYVETTPEAPGVVCDVYTFVNDTTKDLGIIRIASGKTTPRQKVLKGTRTVEGYVKGKGWLLITRADGSTESYAIGFHSDDPKFQKDVNVGDVMQWEAAANSELVAFEVCFPPYADGRYQNL